jgi:hypothetical protein
LCATTMPGSRSDFRSLQATDRNWETSVLAW